MATTVGARSIAVPRSIATSKPARGAEGDRQEDSAFSDKRMRAGGLGPKPGPCSVARANENGDCAAGTARRPAHERSLMSSVESRSARAGRPAARDGRRLRKTKTPGVYRRVDREGKTVGYAAVIVIAGRQRKRMAPTYEAARRLKREGETDRDRGVLEEHGTIRFVEFLDEWVTRYQGQGRRGFRDHSRKEYRRLIEAYAHPYFPKRLKLVEVTPCVLARFVDWLADEGEQKKCLSDKTIANIVIPLRTALKSAQREGLIRHNPSQGLALPHREEDPDEEEVEAIKVLSRE